MIGAVGYAIAQTKPPSSPFWFSLLRHSTYVHSPGVSPYAGFGGDAPFLLLQASEVVRLDGGGIPLSVASRIASTSVIRHGRYLACR